MLKLEPVPVENANDESKEALQSIAEKNRFVPNLFGTFAHGPAALIGYVGMQNTYEMSSLSTADKHAVILAVCVANGGEYCVPAHSTLAAREGIDQSLVTRLRAGQLPDDIRLVALVNFTLRIVRNHGCVDRKDVNHFLRAGFSEVHIMDVILCVAVKTMSNYTNHIFEIDVDPAFQGKAWTQKSAA